MKCLVTGASGFVGSELVNKLLDHDFEVIAIGRISHVTSNGINIHGFDFRKASVSRSLLSGVDVVYHLAGIAHQKASTEDYKRINFEATLELAREANLCGVSRFVFLSSVHAAGASKEIIRPTDGYSDSKLMAETALERLFFNSHMSVDVVRSSLVYGPGVKGNLSLFAKAINNGLPRPPDKGSRSMISLTDLVSFLVLLSKDSDIGVRKFVVTDGEVYSICRIYDAIRTMLGRRIQNRTLPVSVWRFMAFGFDLLLRLPIGTTFQKLFSDEIVYESMPKNWNATICFEDAIDEIFKL